MLIESRAKDVMLAFRCNEARDIDRFLANASCVLLVCERARLGICGESSFDEVLCLLPK